MKVDSHLHVNYKRLSAKDIISYMDRERIDLCWLLTWEEVAPSHPFYTPLTVEEVFEAYEKYPSRIIPMYAPDPGRPDAEAVFRSWQNKGARGCGELKVSLRWDSRELQPLLKTLNGFGYPLVFHMARSGCIYAPQSDGKLDFVLAKMLNTPRYNGLPQWLLEVAENFCGPLRRKKRGMKKYFPGYLLDFVSLEKAMARYPNVKFVGHGPMFWRGISAFEEWDAGDLPRGPVVKGGVVTRLMERHGNLYADLSAYSGYCALVRDPRFAREFLMRFTDRILYGTDNFFLGLREFLESLKLPKEVYRKIYGENAYRLAGASAPAFVEGMKTEGKRLENAAII